MDLIRIDLIGHLKGQTSSNLKKLAPILNFHSSSGASFKTRGSTRLAPQQRDISFFAKKLRSFGLPDLYSDRTVGSRANRLLVNIQLYLDTMPV